jgi:hypothetical protein
MESPSITTNAISAANSSSVVPGGAAAGDGLGLTADT